MEHAVHPGASVTQDERDGACGPHYTFLLCLILGFIVGRRGWDLLLLSLSFAFITLWVWGRRRTSAFVIDHARESLNVQLSCWVAATLCSARSASLQGLFGVVVLVVICLTFFAAHRASIGLSYRYPVCLRLVR